jgi:hypothetical protein
MIRKLLTAAFVVGSALLLQGQTYIPTAGWPLAVACQGGSNDDGPAITAAIATGRPVVLPAGTCTIKTQVAFTAANVQLAASIKITGAGREKTIIDNQTGSYAIFIQGAAGGFANGTYFADFQITSSTATAGAGGIECYKCWYTRYENIHMVSLSGTGIYMPATAGDPDAAIQVWLNQVRMDSVGTGAGGWCANFAAPTGGYFGSNLSIENSNFAICGQSGTAAVPPTTGGVYFDGLIANFYNTSWTTNNGPDLYIAQGSGTSILVTIIGADFENNTSTVLPHVYSDGGLRGFTMIDSQCINNNSFVSQGCVWLTNAPQAVTIDNIQIQASNGNSTYTAFKASGANAVLDTIRATHIIWTSFDFAGQVRFSGFQFNPIPGQAIFQISGSNTAQVIPNSAGAVMPLKLAATGEWVAYHVPTAGISNAGIGGLSANTFYNFYLYNSAAAGLPYVGAIEVSATGGVVDAEGYTVKNGDSTRLYLGFAVSDGSGNFSTTSVQASNYPQGNLGSLANSLVSSGYLSQQRSVSRRVNFNSVADTQIFPQVPAGATRYVINAIYITNASQTLTTATVGVFTAATGGGSAIVTGGTAVTVNTASVNTATNLQSLTLTAFGQNAFNLFPFYFRVTNAQGAAATADVVVIFTPLT